MAPLLHRAAITRISRVMIRVLVNVRIRVGVEMPIPKYGYAKNARTATDGKNRYMLRVARTLYTID